MKKKGFTLIELLAVIVVLAIIALITTPIIIKVIDEARKGAFEDSAYGIVSAAKLYFTDASFEGKIDTETFTFPEDTKLKFSGDRPKSGSVTIDENGKVEMAISNGKWCALKNKDEEKVRIMAYSIDTCEIGWLPSTDVSCFKVDEDGDSITDYTCNYKDVIIPKKINGITITDIGFYAFERNQLTSIVIPEGVTRIGEYAFSSNQLVSVKIPDSVTYMGKNAFSNNRLTSVTIGDGLTSINNSAFSTNQLISVTMGNSVKYIANYAFENNRLTNVKIPSSVTSIGNGAFNNNQLPDREAFIYQRNSDGTVDESQIISYGGFKRENVVIPNGVTSIGEDAFSGNQLVSVTMGNSVENIGSYAFQNNQLTSVTIGNSVKNIGDSAFRNNKLTSIEIPSSANYIGNRAFSDNLSGMKITVQKQENSISGSPWGATSVEWTG